MPILPLDHSEPFVATLGVMLYPATDEADTLKGAPMRRKFWPRRFGALRKKAETPHLKR
jgi:hypothetical protein